MEGQNDRSEQVLDHPVHYFGISPGKTGQLDFFYDRKPISKADLAERLGYPDEETFDKEEPFRVREMLASWGGADVRQTWASVKDYAEDLGFPDRESFVRELEGKKVLDLGSGLGGLAKTVYMDGINAKIYSVCPALGGSHFREDEKKITGSFVRYDSEIDYFPHNPDPLTMLIDRIRGFNRKSLGGAQKYHDERALAAYAHQLPFPENSFDLILDKLAVSSWFKSYNDQETKWHESVYETSIKEIIRVLKPGGKYIIGDMGTFGWVEAGVDPEMSWKEQALKNLGLDYRILWELDAEGNKIDSFGVEIIKH